MLIRKVILENFGLYAGLTEFDLAPRTKYNRKRPIILIGGKNGAGKTTLLEAVRLALYGRTALGNRVRQADYEAHLRGRIHRSRSEFLPAVQSSVAVEFDYVRLGERKTYRVIRSWRPRGAKGIEEQFSLLEEGQPVIGQDQDLAESFAREIVPEGLSQLFFFDGEKIRELAEDRTGDEVLADSIKALLGLNVVERLSADLSIYASRKMTELADDDEQSRLGKIQSDLVQLRTKEGDLADAIASHHTKVEGVMAEIRHAEEQLRSEGHAYSQQRDALNARNSLLKSEIQRKEGELREQCERLFPFALCPNAASLLLAEVEKERQAKVKQHVNNEIKSLADELISLLGSDLSAPGKRSKAAEAECTRLLDLTRGYFQKRLEPSLDEVAQYLALSESDEAAITEILNQAHIYTKPTVQDLCQSLERDFRELERVSNELTRIPNDDVTGPILGRLQSLNERMGAIKQRQQQLQDELDGVQLAIADQQRKQLRLGDQMRYSASGPRILTDDDVVDGRAKIIANPKSEWTIAPAKFRPLLDVARLERLSAQLAERAGTQRGKPRSPDKDNNPLGSRVFDMACGWPMYREPVMEKGEKTFRYKCGAYTQSHGEVCEHNHIGGPVAARFVLSAVQQRLASTRLRALVEQQLRQFAAQEPRGNEGESEERSKAAQLEIVRKEIELVSRNLAYARDQAQHDAIAPFWDQLTRRESDLIRELDELRRAEVKAPNLEGEVQAALGLLDCVSASAKVAADHAACGELFRLVNAKLFLRFESAKWGKRTVRRATTGMLTFGDTPAPIKIYQGKTGRVAIQAALENAKSPHQCGGGNSVSDEKNHSLGNVSRGDRTSIELFSGSFGDWTKSLIAVAEALAG